jgi:phage/plasmid-like protein (TIGR03299 family)
MFAAGRHPVWHGLGQRCDESATAEEAIKLARLDWSVRKEPVGLLRTIDGKQVWVAQDDQFAVTRDEDDRVLGYVGRDYVPFQNWSAFDFLDSLVASKEAKYETAGALFNGRRIWVMAKLPEHIEVAGGEKIEQYLYCETSHDGSKATTVGISPVAIVCANTLNMAIGRTRQSFAIRHTESAQGKIAEARQTLELTFKHNEEFKLQVDKLVTQDLTDELFAEILKANMVWQPKATPRNIEAIVANRRDSGTIRDEQRATAWGGVQSLTEWSQHHRAYRTDESKMKASMGGWAQGLATKVTKDLLTLAGAK